MYSRSAHDVAPSHDTAEKLGPYTLGPVFASGTLATLQRAQLTVAPGVQASMCAIKRLQRRHLNDAELRALLVATGYAAMEVSAPDVVRTLVVHEDPEPFVVMEYIDGASLHQLMRAAPRAELARLAIPIVLDVLDGLQALHQPRSAPGTGLVHRAPCARHILVGRDGMGRLVDLSHAVGPALPWSPRRDERLIPSEMAPEQALAPAHVDARCDLFIVGGVLWEILTGRTLFEVGDAQTSLQNMLRQRIPAPSEAGATVGRTFDRICLRALQRSRVDRYGSAAEMAAALREALPRAGLAATREEIGSVVALMQRAPRARDGLLASKATTTIGFGTVQSALAGAGGAAFRPQASMDKAAAHAASSRAPSVRPAADPHAPTLEALARAEHVPMSRSAVEARSTLTIGTFESPGDAIELGGVEQPPLESAAPVALVGDLRKYVPDGAALAGARVSVNPRADARTEEMRAPAAAPRNLPPQRPGWDDRAELVSVLDPPAPWKEPLPSKPPPRAAPRARSNRWAMFAGFAIALGVPALGLYWSSGLPEAPPDEPTEQPPATAQPGAPAVENTTLEAFLRADSASRGAEAVPAIAPQAPEVREERSARSAPKRGEPSQATAASATAQPRARADRPAAERRDAAAGGANAEPLPINPY
jgi:hypothetical protein